MEKETMLTKLISQLVQAIKAHSFNTVEFQLLLKQAEKLGFKLHQPGGYSNGQAPHKELIINDGKDSRSCTLLELAHELNNEKAIEFLASFEFGAAGMQAIAEALQKAKHPMTIDLSSNEIGAAGMQAIAKTLQKAKHPMTIDLSCDVRQTHSSSTNMAAVGAAASRSNSANNNETNLSHASSSTTSSSSSSATNSSFSSNNLDNCSTDTAKECPSYNPKM